MTITTKTPTAALLIHAAAVNLGALCDKTETGSVTRFSNFQDGVTAKQVMERAVQSATSLVALQALHDNVTIG